MATNTPLDITTHPIRDERGRMLEPLPGKHTITKADASILARKRWDNYRRKAVERIVDEAKSIDPTVSTGADAFGLVAAKQFSALMDSEKPVLGDLERLQKMMTGVDAQRTNESALPGSISVPVPAMLELLRLIEERQAEAVDRARAIDAESTDIRNG